MSKNQRLNASITIGAVLAGSVKKNIGILKSGLHSIGGAIKDVVRRQRELSKQRSELLKQGKSVEALDREYEQLEQTLQRLRRAQERWNNAAAASRRVGAAWSSMVSDIGRKARALGVGATAATAALIGVTNSAANSAHEVGRMSAIANTSTNDFQRMAAAAETVGIENEKLSDILKDMNDRVGDFVQTGGGPMADFFENIAPKVGVTIDSFRELSGKDALQLFVSSLEAANLSQEEMVFYMEAIASDSTALLPLLRNNGREMERLGDRAEKMGRIFDEKAIAAAQEYREAMIDVRGASLGLRDTIGTALMPVFTRSMRAISDWVASNSGKVAEWSSRLANGLEAALPKVTALASGLSEVGTVVGDMIGKVADFVGGWENLGIILGTVLAAGTIARAVKFGFAVFGLGRALFGLVGTLPLVAGGVKALGLALAANPIGLVIAGIAGGAYLIWKNWEPIKGWFAGLWSEVQATFDGFRQYATSVFLGDMSGAWRGLLQTWGGLGDLFKRNLDLITTPLQTAWNGVIRPIMDKLGLTEPIARGWKDLGEAVGGAIQMVGEKFDGAKAAVQAVIADLLSAEKISAAWAAMWEALEPVLTWIGEAFQKLGGIISPVVDALKSVGGAVGGMVGLGGGSEAGTSAGGGASGSWGKPQARAIGGAFRPGPVLTGENGAELIYPNRAGWVAHSRATRSLAGYADKIAAGMRAGMGGGGSMAPAPVTHNHSYTVNATGASADELIAILDRRARQAANAGLYDRVPGQTGPWGR